MALIKVFADIDQLLPVLEERRSRGETIVFANGCFELLHVGHVRYLSASKELGDVLIVGVNTDASMQVIKPDRNVVTPDVERYEIVAALASVDYVVPLRERTPAELLEKIRPHYQTKGTDYTLDRIPEREVVERHGGQVVIVGDPKDHSTTDIRAALRRSGSAP